MAWHGIRRLSNALILFTLTLPLTIEVCNTFGTFDETKRGKNVSVLGAFGLWSWRREFVREKERAIFTKNEKGLCWNGGCCRRDERERWMDGERKQGRKEGESLSLESNSERVMSMWRDHCVCVLQTIRNAMWCILARVLTLCEWMLPGVSECEWRMLVRVLLLRESVRS